MNTLERLRGAMVERLIAAGRLRSTPWIDAFSHVPRHVFLPRFFRQSRDLSGWVAVSADDEGAPELVYSDATWVTQLDDDPARWQAARRSGEPAHGVPTSSSTAPGLMALLLESLDVHDGHRILEIGTGTGYNAALLCHRLGSAAVTTVEVDETVAGVARAALRACGFAPTVLVTDGSAGHPEGPRYDRLLATCSVPEIPSAWLAQVRPGGLITSSLHRDLGGGPLTVLRVDEPGRAEGRFLPDYGSFMPVRTAAPADASARLSAALATEAPDAGARAAAVTPDALDSADFGMVAALRLPGVASIGFDPATGPQRWLLADGGSWACVDEPTGVVSQHGARRLWDEVEEVHLQWRRSGEPSRERLGLSVTGSGEHRFWLDTPQHVWWTQP